ncbi:MAG: 3-methyl-2-oxobutanoate hydroxymethyltransferase [Candidatus Omnitrophota bacterium]|nr:3-methyl-2-oxobutanoate hydroxymethyltransferase [Candidatus Omnitrophota bacterium]MDZ4243057.1 3-methyl-2-oxobutanoate hydroxymethyltransferase [Candidatus Omnitrophota bacterium]
MTKIQDILEKKKRGQKITMLTAYDFPTASLVDRAGVDIVLVGDSLANVMLGLESTREVGMTEMIHHAKAARKGVKNALFVGDMPYASYRTPEEAVANARRFVREAGCEAVKLEWFEDCPAVTEAIVQAGIPVMGHVGLLPQTADAFKVQGKDADSARQIIRQSSQLEEKGCFSLVLECVPDKVAGLVTKNLSIPTIGIGAGPDCDGQVLVIHDVLGLYPRVKPKFVKTFAELGQAAVQAVQQFRAEVEAGSFPDKEHSYGMDENEFRRLQSGEPS